MNKLYFMTYDSNKAIFKIQEYEIHNVNNNKVSYLNSKGVINYYLINQLDKLKTYNSNHYYMYTTNNDKDTFLRMCLSDLKKKRLECSHRLQKITNEISMIYDNL